MKSHLQIKVACALGFALLALIPLVNSRAQSVPTPGLTIALISTNQLSITITNGVSWANYELYRRTQFDPVYPWTLHMMGSVGQTIFTTNMGIENLGFFQVSVGLDWDMDGIPNWADPQPSNPAVSNLVLTIESPAHGTTFN